MPYKEQFKQALKTRRLNMGAGNRSKTKNPTMKDVWLFPSQYENKYRKEISNLVNQSLAPTVKYIQDNLNEWISEYKVDSAVKQDGFSEDFDNLLNEQIDNVNSVYLFNIVAINGFISTLGKDVSIFNNKQAQKFYKRILGMEFNVPEPWESDVIAQWGSANYDLVKSLSLDGIKKMNIVVSDGVQYGKTYKEIMKDIKAIDTTMKTSRAKLLARDQIGKLNGLLSKRRMQESGINLYYWYTMQDERVVGNPSGKFPNPTAAHGNHYVMHNMLCDWNDNSIYSDDNGKTFKNRTGSMPIAVPGQQIQCRCTQLPYFDNIIAEVDKEIEEELAA